MPAATGGMLSITKPKGMLTSITAPTGADDTAKFVVTLTFAAALPAGTTVTAADLMVTGGTVTAVGPKLGDAKAWEAQIMPTGGADVVIGLSDAGKLKFSYSGTALTVKKKVVVTAPTPGQITATYDAATMTTTLMGAIGADGFAVVVASGLPDLEYFFDIGGTITLDLMAMRLMTRIHVLLLSVKSCGVLTSVQHLPIKRCTSLSSSITRRAQRSLSTIGHSPSPKGNVRPAIDIDQVSNRGPGGWEVDTGDTGKSGRVTGTRWQQMLPVRLHRSTSSPCIVISITPTL